MKVRRKITIELTSDDVEVAIKEWLKVQGWEDIEDIDFEIESQEYGDITFLGGATCVVKEKENE